MDCHNQQNQKQPQQPEPEKSAEPENRNNNQNQQNRNDQNQNQNQNNRRRTISFPAFGRRYPRLSLHDRKRDIHCFTANLKLQIFDTKGPISDQAPLSPLFFSAVAIPALRRDGSP